MKIKQVMVNYPKTKYKISRQTIASNNVYFKFSQKYFFATFSDFVLNWSAALAEIYPTYYLSLNSLLKYV